MELGMLSWNSQNVVHTSRLNNAVVEVNQAWQTLYFNASS